MSAGTLNCPMCGASAKADSQRCDHCGARLATVACPECFGMVFQGAKFCSHCGAPIVSRDTAEGTQRCPGCRTGLQHLKLGHAIVMECPRCSGLWVETEMLRLICSEREQQAVILGEARKIAPTAKRPVEKVRYVPCPVCSKLMNRVNFANCSGVVVDVCAKHGTWFDKDELRRIIEFIQSGGMEASRAKQLEELEQARRKLESAKADARSVERYCRTVEADSLSGIRSAGSLLRILLG